MKDHLTRKQLELFIQRKLKSDELLEVDEHLAACEDCRARLLVLIPIDSLTGTLLKENTEPPDAEASRSTRDLNCTCKDTSNLASRVNMTIFTSLSKTF